MNKQVKEQWLNALRSNEYSQAQGQLKNRKGFCCLGVLMDLYIQEKNLDWKFYPGSHEFNSVDSHLNNTFIDWTDIINWSGLPRSKEYVLVDMNDEQDKSFCEIADFIETHY
jgi:hypothetical protein